MQLATKAIEGPLLSSNDFPFRLLSPSQFSRRRRRCNCCMAEAKQSRVTSAVRVVSLSLSLSLLYVCATVIYHNFYILKSHFRIRAKMSASKYNKMANTSTWAACVPDAVRAHIAAIAAHTYAACQRITHTQTQSRAAGKRTRHANSMKFQPSA